MQLIIPNRIRNYKHIYMCVCVCVRACVCACVDLFSLGSGHIRDIHDPGVSVKGNKSHKQRIDSDSNP